jgi:hypothetical protein
MATPLKIEHRCVIKFCVNANMTPTDTLKGQSSLTTKNGLKIWKNKNIRKPVVFVVLIIFNLSSLQNAILFMKNCIL